MDGNWRNRENYDYNGERRLLERVRRREYFCRRDGEEAIRRKREKDSGTVCPFVALSPPPTPRGGG